MKQKNLDIAIRVAELLEQGKCVYAVPCGSLEDLEPGIVSEFPIFNVYEEYIELMDSYCSVKIKRKKSYSGKWPIGNTGILPTIEEIELIRRNISKLRPYIKLPKNYFKESDKFWVINRYNKSQGNHYASIAMTSVIEDVPSDSMNWIIEVIH